jgi:hypothetical protein
MADRFYASYEDGYHPQPAQGRDHMAFGAVAQDQRSQGAQGRTYPEPMRDYAPADFDRHDYDPYDPKGEMEYDRFAHGGAYVPPHQGQPHMTPRIQPRITPRPEFSQPAPLRAQTPQRALDVATFDGPRAHVAQRGRAQTHAPNMAHGFGQNRMSKMVHWAGAACSAVFLIGAVFWAYELAVRDVRGIPVVRAAEGPLRIAPEIPGGKVSANQGLAVNAIAANGATEELPNEVILAPAPLVLAQEDISLAAPAALTELAQSLPEDMPISDEAAVEAALAMALAEGEDDTINAALDLALEPATKSITDAAQPAEIALQQAAFGVSEIDPMLIPVGTKMVQLGAFDDAQSARAQWDNLQIQFADLMQAKALVVQQAKSGGREFFRLRAHGFANEDETRRFCAALLAENASCIPVAQR